MKADDNNQPGNKGLLFSYGLHQRSRSSGWKGEVKRQGGERVQGEEEVRLDLLEGFFPKAGH